MLGHNPADNFGKPADEIEENKDWFFNYLFCAIVDEGGDNYIFICANQILIVTIAHIAHMFSILWICEDAFEIWRKLIRWKF